MRQNIGDPSVHERVDEKGFTAQRNHSVKRASHFPQSTLDRVKLRDMAEMTGHTKILDVGELWNGEQFLKNLQRASLMDQHFRSFGIGSDRYRLYRQCADVDLALDQSTTLN